MSINFTSRFAKSIVLRVTYWIRRIATSYNKNVFRESTNSLQKVSITRRFKNPGFSSLFHGHDSLIHGFLFHRFNAIPIFKNLDVI